MTRFATEGDALNKEGSLQLSERDSLRVLDLLESPPAPNERLLAAARSLLRRDDGPGRDAAE
jgi:uncharacterized protein (DUF1778 family)